MLKIAFKMLNPFTVPVSSSSWAFSKFVFNPMDITTWPPVTALIGVLAKYIGGLYNEALQPIMDLIGEDVLWRVIVWMMTKFENFYRVVRDFLSNVIKKISGSTKSGNALPGNYVIFQRECHQQKKDDNGNCHPYCHDVDLKDPGGVCAHLLKYLCASK